MFGHIARIAATGVAVVLIEQDVHRALTISERAYVLVTGKIAFFGRAEEIANDDRIRSAYLGARDSPGRAQIAKPATPPPA